MFNDLTLIGNIGNDIELRYTPSGVPSCNFRIGVNKKWKNDKGELQEKTLWVNVSCWRKTAELVAEYCKKGMRVLVKGELEDSRSFVDKKGENRVSTEMTANSVLFLSKVEGNGQAAGDSSSDEGGIPF